MLTPNQLKKVLPSHHLTTEDGETIILDPNGETVARRQKNTNYYFVDGEKEEYETVVENLQRLDGIKVDVEYKNQQKKPERIQNFGNIDKYLNAMKGSGGIGNSSSSIIFNSDGNVVFATNNYQNAQVLKHRFYNVSAARVGGNIASQRFEITVPLEFFKTFKEIIQ